MRGLDLVLVSVRQELFAYQLNCNLNWKHSRNQSQNPRLQSNSQAESKRSTTGLGLGRLGRMPLDGGGWYITEFVCGCTGYISISKSLRRRLSETSWGIWRTDNDDSREIKTYNEKARANSPNESKKGRMRIGGVGMTAGKPWLPLFCAKP